MSSKPRVPALDGWHTMDTREPHLLGSRCGACGTYFFPKRLGYCGNPDCDSDELAEVELSRTGTLWSYTNACYRPPEPFVAEEPFQPFAIAAVQLEKERMTILGQVVAGTSVDDLRVGMAMELALETLHEDEAAARVTWKWKPAPVAASQGAPRRVR